MFRFGEVWLEGDEPASQDGKRSAVNFSFWLELRCKISAMKTQSLVKILAALTALTAFAVPGAAPEAKKFFGPDAPDMPAIGDPLHGDSVHYHIREGKHNLTLEDWNFYMDYADILFKRKQP